MEKILIGVASGSIVLILSILSRKYLEPIMPEKKKANSIIKKFLVLAFKYILPIIFLIYIFIEFEFNKYFILLFCLVFGILLFNIFFEYENYIYKKRKCNEKTTFEKMAEIQDELSNKFEKTNFTVNRLEK